MAKLFPSPITSVFRKRRSLSELPISLTEKIKKLAVFIDRNPVPRLLFFLLWTILTIVLIGYYFGTFDQSSHIPFLKKTVDGSLYPNDKFFSLRLKHYSYFWFLFIPFVKVGLLNITVFMVHVAVVFFTYVMIWKLSKTIFNDPLVAIIAVFTFIIPHIGFAGFPVFEFSLLNRTFIFPFLLLAIDFYLRKKYSKAFIILGLAYNIHVISVSFVLFFFIFDTLSRLKFKALPFLLKNLFVFSLFALPVLVWKFSSSTVGLGIDNEWFHIVSKAMLYNVFYIFSSSSLFINLITLSGFGSVLLFIFSYYPGKNDRLAIIGNFIIASLIIILVGILTAYFLPIIIIIQLQIIRVGVFILFFGYLYFINYVVEKLRKKSLTGTDFIFLTASIIFFISPFLTAVVWLLYLALKNKQLWRWLVIIMLVATTSLSIYAASVFDIWRGGINIYPKKTAWFNVQLWAKKNTSKSSLFITPPYKWGFFTTEWRVGSERSTVATLSEILEAAFVPSYIPYWKGRFNDLAPGALSKFRGDYFANVNYTKAAYYSLSKKDFEKISSKYNAHYLVIEKPHSYNFPILFENKNYFVYFVD